MTMSDTLPTAEPGELIAGADLQQTVDLLIEAARRLDGFVETATEVEAAQDIGRTQARLRSLAATLIDQQIELVAGEARVTAAQINAATRYADEAIAKVADWKARVRQLGRLVEFVGALLSGSGSRILKTAQALKDELDAG
jgi:hypothetical protein